MFNKITLVTSLNIFLVELASILLCFLSLSSFMQRPSFSFDLSSMLNEERKKKRRKKTKENKNEKVKEKKEKKEEKGEKGGKEQVPLSLKVVKIPHES